MFRAAGVSDKGSIRPTNQDRFIVDEEARLCVVADGLGGHRGGEVAAATAVAAVHEVVRDRSAVARAWPFGFDPTHSESVNLIRTAIQFAHVQVREAAGRAGGCADMGTTLVVALEADGGVAIGHVGDSRLYVLRGSTLRQVTDDDSWAAAVAAAGPRGDRALLEYHPMRHALTNVVGGRQRAEVHVAEERLAPGDRLLLTTDGVHGVLDAARLQALLLRTPDPGQSASRIVHAALSRGSGDNCTAVVAACLPARAA